MYGVWAEQALSSSPMKSNASRYDCGTCCAGHGRPAIRNTSGPKLWPAARASAHGVSRRSLCRGPQCTVSPADSEPREACTAGTDPGKSRACPQWTGCGPGTRTPRTWCHSARMLASQCPSSQQLCRIWCIPIASARANKRGAAQTSTFICSITARGQPAVQRSCCLQFYTGARSARLTSCWVQ